MLPQAPRPPAQNSPRVNLLISLGFHGAIILALVFFAAREGLLGTQLKRITIQMVKQPPPEKPKPEPPKVELARVEPPREARTAPPPATGSAPAAVAPAAAELPSFEFGGGKAVQTSSDPVLLYNAAVEFALRSNWRRPANIVDDDYVAEVEVAVDHAGHISDPIWKKGSGNARWDDSVRQAISATANLDRPPPPKFPARVLVRFDVQESTEPVSGISQ